jgi:hypothetical protein
VAKALHLGGDITSVRLFAVGRFAARFKSYGYNHAPSSVAVCSWPQLSRIRKQLNTDNNILQSIYEGIIKERSRAISVTAIPYEVKIGDNRLVFHNIWNNFDEEEAAT